MIRLNEISPELKREYWNYRFVKLKNCLEELKGAQTQTPTENLTDEETLYCKECKKITEYLSQDNTLDDGKIENLLIGDISKLKAAVEAIGAIESVDIKKKFNSLYTDFINHDFGKNWAAKMGVTVCPYCNRSYVFTVKSGGARPQYDHFFPKSKYPYLAISMYNLIPCCSVCNLAKHDDSVYENGKLTILYPYENGYGNQAAFSVSSKDDASDYVSAWLGTAAEYTVSLAYADGIDGDLKTQIENSWNAFKLKALYEQHNDYIRDVLRTKYIYSDEYFEGLAAEFPFLFSNADEAKNMVYFNYLDEEDWGKRVLAKLTHDLESMD